jgi:hypothetical protein
VDRLSVTFPRGRSMVAGVNSWPFGLAIYEELRSTTLPLRVDDERQVERFGRSLSSVLTHDGRTGPWC